MKRVCIIGAGASGIAAIKSCLDEDLIPICFERSHDIGGLWRYEANDKEGASVYKSTIINTSKEMMSYSDFPIPKEFPNFMHNTKITEYMRLYAKHFDLVRHIRFHTDVIRCERADDYVKTGKWKVTTKNRQTEELTTDTFDGVLVCIGHHATPHFPTDSFKGFEKFKGKTIHSHSYKLPFEFEDKRVVVIGIGNSGGDISVELGKHASKVFLSTRRGAWIFYRVGPNGVPGDTSFTTRSNEFIRNVLPSSLTSRMLENVLNKNFDHAKYGLKPKHKPLGQHPTLNDSLPNSILSGMVVVKGNVREFNETGVVFEDGSEEEIDVVIFATGYSFNYPFLDDDVIKVNKNNCRLFRHMWPPQLEHGTLAVIGGIQPLGAINPISEIQCRWATRVIKSDLQLPSCDEMERSVDEELFKMKKRYYNASRHTIQVDYIKYMDDIANEIGVKPNVFELFKNDFQLAVKVFFGPATPYQYRLVGRGSWPKARDTIMSQDERILYPLNPRKADKQDSLELNRLIFLSIVAISVLVWIFLTC